MLWFILPIVIYIISSFVYKRHIDMIIFILMVTCSLLIGIVVYEVLPKKTYDIDIYPIVSIGSFHEVKGDFILGTGEIKEETVFLAYKKTGDYYQLIHIPAEKTIIIEDSICYGSIVVQAKKPHFKHWKWLALKGPKNYRYVLHVPKGTIIKPLEGAIRWHAQGQ